MARIPAPLPCVFFSIRRHRAKNPPESVGWGNEALPKHERLEPQSDPSGARRSRREFQVGPSEASMPIQDRLNLWINKRTLISFSSVVFLCCVFFSP